MINSNIFYLRGLKVISIFLFFYFLYISLLFPQNYNLTFSASGLSANLDQVTVLNLAKNTTKTIFNGDTLVLVRSSNIESQIIKSDLLNVYPNPSSDFLFFEYNNCYGNNIKIELIDNIGRTCLYYETFLEKGKAIYNLKGMGMGVFYLKITSNNRISIKKIISLSEKSQSSMTLQQLDYSDNETTQKNVSKGTVLMNYTDGDYLLLQAHAGTYSRVKTIMPTQSQEINFHLIECIDGDGNNYSVVTVGNQTWMAENLRSRKFNDGTPMLNEEDYNSWFWLSVPAYAWYDNDSVANNFKYGILYNWKVVDTLENGNKNVCPIGWRVPSHNDWTILERALCTSQTCETDFPFDLNTSGPRGNDEGGMLKGTRTWPLSEPCWIYTNNASNKSGFSIYPSGVRQPEGNFKNKGEMALLWTSTKYSESQPIIRILYYYSELINRSRTTIYNGLAIRCVKED